MAARAFPIHRTMPHSERHDMASQPAPDTIQPQSPPEVPAEPNPIEAPQQQPDEAPMTEPDTVQPGNTPPEVPQG